MSKTIRSLKRSMNLYEFYKFVQTIANDYAESSPSRARSNLVKQYDISPNTYYSILEIAITHGLITDLNVKKTFEKTLANQNVHGNSGYTSKSKYALLLIKRKNASDFSKKDIKEIATYFANNPELSKKDIATYFSFTNSHFLDNVLLRACEECIIPDKTFSLLKERANRFANDKQKTLEFFENLSKTRIAFKQLHKKITPM